MSKTVEIINEETGEYDSTRKFRGMNSAVENGQNPEAVSVRWATDVPLEIRRKLTYRLVERTRKGTGPNRMPVLIAEGEGLRFVSNPMGPDTEVYRGVACIENEEKQTVRFLPTNNYCLYPDFSKDDDDDDDDEEETEAVAKEEPTNLEKKQSLIAAFGGAKGNRLVSASQRNALVLQKQTRQDVVKAIEEADILSFGKVEDLLDERSASVSYLPPHHLDARLPHEAYLFTDMLSEYEMNVLTTYASPFVDANFETISEWRFNNKYSGFVLRQLETLPLKGDERNKKSAMLMYLNIIYTLWNSKVTDWKNKNPLPQDLPESLRHKLTSEFMKSIPGRHALSMPRDLKDKALLYICALALMLNDFILDFTMLETDTGRKLKLYFEQLGCRVTLTKSSGLEGGTSQRAVLNTPLTFPKAKGQKRKAMK